MGQQIDDYNRGGFYAFVFTIVFSFAFFIVVTFMMDGVDLKEVPESAGEGTMAVADGGGAAKKVDVSGVTNPWVSSEDLVAHGKSVYATNCTICHGEGGLGDGPAGKAIKPPPRNLVEGGWKKGGDAISLYTTIQKGLEGTSMAAFGHLPKVDRWALVHFIHSITKNKGTVDDAKLEAFATKAE